MKWILIIVVMNLAEDLSYRSVPFETQAACVVAGQALVARFPGFEWHDPSDETTVEAPVVRSHVRCLEVEVKGSS